jgi:tripartite-type tricarboxylate transporter receptor subunit TctC
MADGSKLHAAASLALLTAWPLACGAQAPAGQATDYPTRAVRVIAPYAAGGGVDITARLFAQKFQETFKQPFVVENRPGAGGNIGHELVARSAPDGYTLMMTGTGLAINVSLYPRVQYDAVKDFAPISMVASTGTVFCTHPSIPARTLKELIALARARPGEVPYASAGVGSPQHLAMELFMLMARIKLLQVPYNGGGPSLAAALGGHVGVLSASLPISLPHIRAGKLRALGVTTAKPSALAPEIPPVAVAAGLPTYDVNPWYMLLAPAGTPPAIVNKLNAEVERLVKTKEVMDRMLTLGFDIYVTKPAQTLDIIRSDVDTWRRVVKEANVRVDID